MKTTRIRSALRSSARPARISRALPAASPALTWIHDGYRHRASIWPEVMFERRFGGIFDHEG